MPVRSILLQRFLATVLIAIVCGGCAQNRLYDSYERLQYSHEVMGTTFTVTLYTDNKENADKAAEAAFNRLDALNQILSDYEDDSELSLLSASSGSDTWVPLSDELYTVLRTSHEISEKSGGAFDPTVGPLSVQWRMAQHTGRLPRPEAIQTLKQRVGYQKVLLDHEKKAAKLTTLKMKLDLGGIAKGYALDEAMRTLESFGITRVLIDGGGDLLAADPPPGKTGWPVTLSHQDMSITLANEAAATSGDASRYVEIDGKRYSHILDPHTGMGMINRCHATVFARSGMYADALASALCVLGPDKSKDMIAQYTKTRATMTKIMGANTNHFSFGIKE